MATSAAPETPPPGAPASVLVPADPAHPRKLSEEFALILREFEVETVTLREVLGVMRGRGFVLLVMLLALPFCTPIPLPGLSTPIGLIIGLIGARLALGAKPWLPARLLDTRLPPETFKKVFAVTRRLILGFERLLRPRLAWLTSEPWRERAHAVTIVLCAALLLLPLPIPFSNTLPAWSILLVAGGLLERDGVFLIAGHFMALVAAAFFAVLGIFGVEAFHAAWRWLVAQFA